MLQEKAGSEQPWFAWFGGYLSLRKLWKELRKAVHSFTPGVNFFFSFIFLSETAELNHDKIFSTSSILTL